MTSFYRDVNSTTPTDRPDVTDVKSVSQSILNLLKTRKGEIPFNPAFGLDLEENLFDLMDDNTELIVLTSIFDAVERFEPRADIDTGASTVELDIENNKIDVTLYFNIKGFADDQTFSVSASLTG